MAILTNTQEMRIKKQNDPALGQFTHMSDNSQILHFLWGPFKTQLHFILRTANHFQLSCSIPFAILTASQKRCGGEEAAS